VISWTRIYAVRRAIENDEVGIHTAAAITAAAHIQGFAVNVLGMNHLDSANDPDKFEDVELSPLPNRLVQ